MACSEKQRAANRRNAQLSTGPRTDEGKQASRRNALKHGMCSDVVALVDEDPEAIAFERERWIADLSPQGHVAARLADRAFRAYLKLDRCDRVAGARALERQEWAVREWDRARSLEVSDAGKNLSKSPRQTLIFLRSTPQGCVWLRKHWEDQIHRLMRFESEDSFYFDLLNLLGFEGEPESELHSLTQMILEERTDREALSHKGLPPNADAPAMLEHYIPEFVKSVLHNRIQGEKARSVLLKMFQKQVDELKRIEEEVRPGYEALRAQARTLALCDFSPEALKQNRYAGEADREMHRNLKAAQAASRLALAEEIASARAEAEAEEIPNDRPAPEPKAAPARSIESAPSEHAPIAATTRDLQTCVEPPVHRNEAIWDNGSLVHPTGLSEPEPALCLAS